MANNPIKYNMNISKRYYMDFINIYNKEKRREIKIGISVRANYHYIDGYRIPYTSCHNKQIQQRPNYIYKYIYYTILVFYLPASMDDISVTNSH